MVRLLTDGLECGDALDMARYQGAAMVGNTVVHTGNYALNMASTTYYAAWDINPTISGYAKFNLRRVPTVSANLGVLSLAAGTTAADIHLHLQFTTDGKFLLRRGTSMVATGSAVLPSDAWCLVKLFWCIDDTNNT